MAKLDALLRKYRERTACDPIEPVELKVLARLRGREAASVGACLLYTSDAADEN